MRRILTILLLIGAAAAAAAAAEVEGFLSTWTEAQKAAKAHDKPVYLHFTTTWCSWCRRIEKDIYATSEGKEALKDFVTASLDCTVPRGQRPTGDARTHIELMRKYGGGGFPFLVMLAPDGALLHSFAGYNRLPAFKQQLDKARRMHKEYKQLQADAKSQSGSYAFNVRAMKVYVKVQKMAEAVAAAKAVRKLDPKNRKGDGAAAVIVLLEAALAKGDKAGAKTHLAAVRKLDAANKKGVLEEALFAVANSHLGRAQDARGTNAAESTRRLRAAAAHLSELAGLPNVADRQMPLAYLGQTHLSLGEKAKALAAFEKALAAAPNSRIAPRIRQIIQQLKKPGGPPARQN